MQAILNMCYKIYCTQHVVHCFLQRLFVAIPPVLLKFYSPLLSKWFLVPLLLWMPTKYFFLPLTHLWVFHTFIVILSKLFQLLLIYWIWFLQPLLFFPLFLLLIAMLLLCCFLVKSTLFSETWVVCHFKYNQIYPLGINPS